MTPKAQSMKERIDKLDFIKIKSFFSAKDNVKRVRRQAIAYEKIFAKNTPHKGLLSKTYKELLKFNNKKIKKKTTNLKKWAKDQNRHLTKEDIQMANKHVKSCST